MPEEELVHIIEGCVAHRRESQQAFYQYFYGFSMAICLRYCSRNDDAMEVVNDGFLKIFRKLPRFQPSYAHYESSLRGWMKSIMIHTAIDHFRKHQHHQLHDINETHFEGIDHGESGIDKLSYKELISAVQRLSPMYRAVFNLYVIDGYKHEEIAAQLKISIGTSKSNLAKAKENIKKMLTHVNSTYYERKAV